MNTETLLSDLIERTKENLNRAEQLKLLTEDQLTSRPKPEAWNALECIEHLNRYGYFYLPEIEHRIKSSNHKSVPEFKSGWLGDYFAKSMLPKGKLNKMRTFNEMNPSGSSVDIAVLDTFLKQQHKMLELLDRARTVHLARTKTSISISKLIKLRLGDTFRVVIYHNQRHLLQAEKASHVTTKSSVTQEA